ncbi:MAG TPA: peptidylprolyl isomerase, partial [Hellea balneolensis]|nr:peptidylprolyl isomerase [Hellea balneolensis]
MKNLTLKIPLLPLLAAPLLLVACQGQHVIAEKPLFGDKVVRLGDTVVAEVEGTSIYLSDVEHAAQAKGLISEDGHLTPKDPLFQSTLDELIDQRLLALEALKRSLDQDNETKRRLAMARERILADVVVADTLSKAITDDAVKRMYEEQKALQTKAPQIRARKLVVADEKTANQLKELIEKGGDFAELA